MAFSTRSGVRCRPSRSGSSPSLMSTSRISGAMESGALGAMTLTAALLDFMFRYFKDVASGFLDSYLLQLGPFPGKRRRPVLFQAPAYFQPQVLRCRYGPAKRL